MKTRKCKCGATQMLVAPRWYNSFRKPTWVCVAKKCPHRKPIDPTGGARPAGYYTTEMFKLRGWAPGKAYGPRRHIYMRRNMCQATADRVNMLYTQLGWNERWYKE